MEKRDKEVERLAYSIREAAEASSLSQPKLRKDIKNGTLQSKLKGTRRIILAVDLERYLNHDDESDTSDGNMGLNN